jgi:hypothetical protein
MYKILDSCENERVLGLSMEIVSFNQSHKSSERWRFRGRLTLTTEPMEFWHFSHCSTSPDSNGLEGMHFQLFSQVNSLERPRD